MKKLLLMIAAVGLLFTACNNDCDHDFIEYDYSEALVGTWTYLSDEGLAEAMVINPDGSFEVTGIMQGGSLYESKGTIKVVNNKISLVFEGETEATEGRLELVVGKSMSIVINDEYDIRLTYDYCKEDLSDEIIGMWVCTDSNIEAQNDMLIQTFNDNGKTIMTGYLPTGMDAEYILGEEGGYKVFGDLVFIEITTNNDGDNNPFYVAKKLIYTPKATSLGDVMTFRCYISIDNNFVEMSESWLRIKQNLNLDNGKTYDYSSAYVSNAKGKDEDFSMMGNTFNMANIEGGDFDDIFGSDLYSVELNANSIIHKFHPNGQEVEVVTPITVEGNKVTLDMSAVNPACRKVEMYMFQDVDDSQLHMYMHTNAFINYFANLWLPELIAEGKIDKNDASAIEKVYTDMEARIESINVSFVFKATK